MLAHPQCEHEITAGARRVNLRVKSMRWAGNQKLLFVAKQTLELLGLKTFSIRP